VGPLAGQLQRQPHRALAAGLDAGSGGLAEDGGLTGEKIGPLGQAVANITPDKDTGIGDWKQEDIVELLRTGTKPDLDNVQGLMYEVIQGTSGGYKDMKKEDALAIAAYLKSLPAIKNKINK